MINPKTNQRELAYVVKVNDVRPIPGRDRVECAVVGGWTCMVPKGQFQPGSLGIYFEIDSQVDISKEYFAFTGKYHGKIKTQKFKTPEGQFLSQGLLMAPADFGWENDKYVEGDFLTKELGVVYAEASDNARKVDSVDRYKKMAQRHPKIFRNFFVKWLYKRMWGKKLLYVFFGRKSDKKKEWPAWVVKTDEERVQNLSHMISEYAKEPWIATEKVDGTSTTFSYRKDKFYVCSRNVVMNQPGKEKTCYYEETDGNVYMEMANKYDMVNVLKNIYKELDNIEYVTIQAETYGGSIQKRNYSTKEHDMAVFNVILGYKDTSFRLNPNEGAALMAKYNIPYVPVIGEIELPSTCEEILTMAEGVSKIDGLPREGLVFRSLDGSKSFKAVDNNFLVKYH